MADKIKVLFLINSLGGGGAERVLVNLANHMDHSRYDITIQTIFNAGVNKKYLNQKIKLVVSGWRSFKGVSVAFKLIPAKILYRLFIKDNEYDLVVAYMHGVPTKILYACSEKSAGKIAWLHTNMKSSSLPKIFFSRKQIIKVFDAYDKIVGVSDTVSHSFQEMYGLEYKLVTKYNTNDVAKIFAMSEEKLNNNLLEKDLMNIISVGNLHKAKGYDRLLKVCKRLLDRGLKFRLIIIGGGSGGQINLQQYIDRNNLNNYIKLLGFISNPYPYLKKADLFVCSSRSEGLSTVVSEAIILGTPVISTIVSGAEEVLGKSGEHGMLVENSEEGLYAGLKDLLSNPQRIEFYRDKAAERANFFDTAKTVNEVQKLFEEVYRCKTL